MKTQTVKMGSDTWVTLITHNPDPNNYLQELIDKHKDELSKKLFEPHYFHWNCDRARRRGKPCEAYDRNGNPTTRVCPCNPATK